MSLNLNATTAAVSYDAFHPAQTPYSHGSAAATASIQAIGTVAHFGPNETIFAEGDDARYAYKVISGAVRICKLLADGRRQITEFALEGDHFGFEWTNEHAVTAEALGPVTALRFPRARIERLEREEQGVRNSMIAMLRRDLLSAQNHLLMLGRQTAKERVASFLLLMAERREGGNTIDVPMSRQDIADYLGLTIETVCRALSELKRARVIAIPNRHQIVVRNTEALETMALGENDK
ncbi:MAG TPA: helix-turn-helix domain-containing protein [Rhizomicrobium sp.]|nr:helix-turn-helix domain-containing protein [Rhizomicrobium sp.]